MNSKEILPSMIVVRLNAVGQLFNTMDPSPFHERDLDHDAEEFIVSSARGRAQTGFGRHGQGILGQLLPLSHGVGPS